MPHPAWWRGQRGEWYVAVQAVLFMLVAFGPVKAASWPDWPPALAFPAELSGAALCGIGLGLVLWGVHALGKNLTPLPAPKDDAVLVVQGPYRLVRHPIYSGLLLAALGWALYRQASLTLLYAAILFVFFDVKARREEVWLRERYSGYADYAGKVKRLLPFIY